MKPSQLQKTKSTIRFNAKIGSETILTLPASASAKLPQGTTIIEGTINHSPFRATLRLGSKGEHQLKFTKAMRDVVGVADLDMVEVEITRVADEPETRVPADLHKALAATPKAKNSWADITPLARRDWIFSICTAKQEETRMRRIEKACDMLASGHRRLCCFPGIKWMMKENAKTCGMWMPLSNVKNHSKKTGGG